MTCYQLICIISIDSMLVRRRIRISLSIKSKKKEVIAFLNELRAILQKEYFNIDTDFILIHKKKKKEDEKFSTPYTLLDLDYDIGDVVERLKELTVEEYSETKIDKDNMEPPLLFVFGKNINNKQVYVKLKIKEEQPRPVLCVSFHYAKEKMLFPYA